MEVGEVRGKKSRKRVASKFAERCRLSSSTFRAFVSGLKFSPSAATRSCNRSVRHDTTFTLASTAGAFPSSLPVIRVRVSSFHRRGQRRGRLHEYGIH